jgi:uncharacterized iron-regulated protein
MNLTRYRDSLLSATLTIALVLGFAPAGLTTTLPHHHISISFDLKKNRIYGSVEVTVPEDVQAILVGKELSLTRFSIDGKSVKPKVKEGRLHLPPHSGSMQVLLEYMARYPNHERQINGNTITEEGVFLVTQWYPAADAERARFSLEAKIPAGFHAVSEADCVTVRESGQNSRVTFDFAYPAPRIHFVMAPYQVDTDHYGDIEIATYLLPEDQHLAARYLRYTKKYLQMYEEMLGPYPFRRFAIVENILPTGYGMPTFTLLGRQVLKLPFIPETSLGHEILHCWFGNSVYVDYAGGNWSEGLTTYLADHHYKELGGEGWNYRKKIIEDYQSYVHEDNEIPVARFVAGENRSQRAVGYGKTAMVFHMLRRRVGDEVFNAGLRAVIREHLFQLTSWEDLQRTFSETAGEDLSGFFTFWLEQKGLISLELKRIRAKQQADHYEVTFTTKVSNSPIPLNLPVQIRTEDGTQAKTLSLTTSEQMHVISFDSTPREIIVDPDYDLFRSLWRAERRPVLSRMLGDPTRTLVLPEENRRVYASLIQELKDRGFKTVEIEKVNHSTLGEAALLFLGPQGKFKNLFMFISEAESGFSLEIRENVFSPKRVFGLVLAANGEEVSAVAKKLHHYGKYSRLKFAQGKVVEKIIDDTARGGRVGVPSLTTGIDLESLLPLDEIIRRVEDRTVVYVGEKHTRYSDHLLQLEVIQGLSQRHPKLAIGMEMFQRRYQKAVDDYISGQIDENTFLKRTHYFTAWGFEYNLYRDILDYARANHIPVIALNQNNELVSKVAEQGLDALDENERTHLPEQMDWEDEAYQNRLRDVFDMHQTELPGVKAPRVFEYFHQAQILWDETMAESVATFLTEHSDYRMVVLAGSGHLVFGSGIPKRVYRRIGKDYAIILPDPEEPLEAGLADFIVFPSPAAAPESPQLGVLLDSSSGQFTVTGFSRESGAQEAGMQAGDVILAVDDQKVKDINDLRGYLATRQVGDTVIVKVQRGEAIVRIQVELKSRPRMQ